MLIEIVEVWLVFGAEKNSNPFANPKIAATYENWYLTIGSQADQREKDLLKWLLSRFSQARTILEVGCGTGHFRLWFGTKGLKAVGLDLSRPMLDEAKGLGDMDYVQGNVLELPLSSKSFDLVALITSLEFVSQPMLALVGALRVARQGLILGVLNSKSRLGLKYKQAGGPIWEAARFFTPFELERMLQSVAKKKISISWRTTLWLLWPGALPLPWGGFIGMAVKI